MLIGAGRAGSAIGVAIAYERPTRIRLFDLDEARVEALAGKIRSVNHDIAIEFGMPALDDQDILINASPVGMLDDKRLPIRSERLPRDLVVFDAIVKPERTPLLQLAEACGCPTVYGREMMRGQIELMTDYFGFARPEQI
jgi:shikimate dehydrogenase